MCLDGTSNFPLGLDCCDPCGHSYGYYTDNHLPNTCGTEKPDCNPNDRCCRGAVVEGCGCPPRTFDDGNKCQNESTRNEIPCSSSVVVSSITSSTVQVPSPIKSTSVVSTSLLSTSVVSSSSPALSSQV